ncbi:unnamed protein product [Rotaria sordida]|uniref:C2 domain-containing protein n=1 Tax=Rotaria sordida TaxID=392033 RepID=A0A814A5S7_9BILA|nr:unnamed protein product [Rotaria sordida]CAF3612301.1 unnamed protein product [Rotaria sordida]
MLSSLKKWVHDVTVDLTPPPSRSSPSSSFSIFSSSSITESTPNNFNSIKSFHEQRKSRDSSSSAVYLSRPISMDSLQSSRKPPILISQPPTSPVELDLSHLNREEQEHIANVLRRARAVEEQQSNLLSVTIPSIMSPPASITSSTLTSSSSSSSSTTSFTSEQLEKNDNEIQDENEKTVIMPESTLTNIYQCQICGKEHQENSSTCLQCQEKEFINRDIDNNITFSCQQLIPIKKSLSPVSILYNNHKEKEEEEEEEDKIYDNITIIDSEQIKQNSSIEELTTTINHNSIENQNQQNQSIISDLLRTNNLTEIDENEFFYEEPSPYITVITSNKNDEEIISTYHIDEFIDEDNNHERDHVKELEETIANLSRHFPSEQIEKTKSTILPINNTDTTTSILEMEIESPPSIDELSLNSSKNSIPIPIPINNHRINLSRSSGIRENLTDLLIPATTTKPHQTLQRTLSTHSKHMLSINRQKRNLPSVPNVPNSNQLQLRRANSESRFSLPAVSLPILISQHNIDDESDLLEIDLNDPIGSMNRSSCLKTEYENKKTNETYQYIIKSLNGHSSKVKQLRDQTTNTPPMSSLNSSIKSKKKLKKKNSLPLNNINDQITSSSTISSLTKLQKSTSTDITYPFPVTKLILNPSRHGISTDLGFRITGGHSIPNCMEVTGCIENINIHHRNYEILKNIVQEGDEVLEVDGVSLRGKSALFVENLMNTMQNEFEIIVRSQSIKTNSDSLLPIDTNIQRRHTMGPSQLPITEPTNNTIIKSKSTSIPSLDEILKIPIDNFEKQEENLPSIPKSTNPYSHRPRASLLPNDRRLNGIGSNISIDQQNSIESDETDSLSHYFNSSPKLKTNSIVTGNTSISHGRSQSVIPLASDLTSASRRLQSFLKSDIKRSSKDLTDTDRKSSLALISLQLLKKKTKSADFSHQKNLIMNQLRENQYVGDIEIQIRHDYEREQLVVGIIRAKNLLPKDANGFSDPFVKIYLLPGRDTENKRRIKHVSKTLNPVWNHTVIYGNMHREELKYKKLEFTVWDYDRFKANDFLGQVIIDLKNPNVIDDKPHWHRLQALRSREEITNRSSSPRLNILPSTDSTTSSTLTINKNSVNIQPRSNQQT